jgi:uncharacterized RDD family membrane protein YckC
LILKTNADPEMAEESQEMTAAPDPIVPAPVEEPVHIRGDLGKTLYLAKWLTRFWAWIIDVILIILFLNIVRGTLEFSWTIHSLWDWQHWEPFEIGFQTIFFFLYWTVFESYKGQSIGKMVMNIRVVNRDGTKIHYGMAAVESFGKAFLLPFDCLIGWLGMPGSKLRVFNRISNTIVIKTDYKEPEGILYIREKE